MNARDVLEYFQNRQSVMVSAIREMVDIESPSHNVEQSRAVAAWIGKYVRDLDQSLEVETVTADGEGEHLIIRAFRGEGPSTMLLGHTDTVHPLGTNVQNPTRIDDDRFYGCGIFDMKANVVLMLETLRFFTEYRQKPASPITILLSCDEEVGSISGRPLLEREAASAARCFVFEPSANGRVKTGRKGTGMYRLRAHGRPAHAGLEPEKGANAILEIARQIEQIHAVAKPEIGTTVNVTTIQGGTALNVIPEHAECGIDVRFSTTAEAERVDIALRALQAVDSVVTLEVFGGLNRPPLERTEAVVALYEKARSIAASFGFDLGETQVGGASDGNFVGALGVPVLDGLGIAGDGAHALNEHILISDIANRATLVTMLCQ